MQLFQLCDIKFTSFLRRSILPSPVFLFFFAHVSCSHYMTEVDVWVRENQSRKFYHTCTTLQSFIFDYSRNCELLEAMGDYESDSEPPSSGDLFITDAMNSSNDGRHDSRRKESNNLTAYTTAEKLVTAFEYDDGDDDDVESVSSWPLGSVSGSEVSPETADFPQSNNAKSRSSTRQQRTQSRRIRTYPTYITTPSPSRPRSRLAPIGANESSSSSRFYGQSAAISRTNHSTESNSATPSRQNSISQNPKRLAGISAGTAVTTDFSSTISTDSSQPVSSSENEHDDGNVFNDFEPRIVEASQADSSVLRALQEITGLVIIQSLKE